MLRAHVTAAPLCRAAALAAVSACIIRDAAALRRVAPELKAFFVVLISNICDYIYNRAGATGIFFVVKKIKKCAAGARRRLGRDAPPHARCRGEFVAPLRPSPRPLGGWHDTHIQLQPHPPRDPPLCCARLKPLSSRRRPLQVG